MRSLKRVMELLFESNYLQAMYSGDEIGMKLLRNGEIYQKLLLDQWRNVDQLATSKETKDEETSRLSFVNSRSFKETLQELVRTDAFVSGTTIKRVLPCTGDSLNDSNYRVLNNQKNKLVTEYFVPASRGQDTFYSVQRERKIWWMRFSADPSRYFVEPYDVSQELGDDHSVSTKIQSITIKSMVFDNPMNMETITLIPLDELKRFADKSYLHFDLIRSVIDIDLTTCALLMDAGGHNGSRYILKLNRKLAPYQYQIVSAPLCEDVTNNSGHDLSLHVNHVLRRAGLRSYHTPIHANSKGDLSLLLKKADILGIPYTIILEDSSLKTGLMKLRSRDTSLSETIHISDLPTYLLHIFEH